MDKQTRNDASEYLEVAVAVELSRLAGGQHHAAVRDRERGVGHVIPVRVHREGAGGRVLLERNPRSVAIGEEGGAPVEVGRAPDVPELEVGVRGEELFHQLGAGQGLVELERAVAVAVAVVAVAVVAADRHSQERCGDAHARSRLRCAFMSHHGPRHGCLPRRTDLQPRHADPCVE